MAAHKLSAEEKRIEKQLLSGNYVPVNEDEYSKIATAVLRRKKDKVLNVRINSADLEGIKRKAKKFGIKYQTFISEILHKVAI